MTGRRLPLTLACGDYDRTRALYEGTITPDGIDLTYLRLPVEETFFRMARHREFEVAEMSLSSYLVSLARGDTPFVALPVFTSRMFRHGSVYVRADAGIERPEDLAGRRVGTPEYQLTAGVWVRGILADEYGIGTLDITYLTGGQESPGRPEKLAPPPGLPVRPIGPGRTLSGMLVEGEIDALVTPRIPLPFVAGDPRVRRLFPDVVGTERDYFGRTGIFPIMHVVVVRRDVYERGRWVAQSLTKAFGRAKAEAEARLYDSSALPTMLPWMVQQLEEARALLGPDYWSYGLEANRGVLETFLRYHHAQGLSDGGVTADALFAPESLESFVI